MKINQTNATGSNISWAKADSTFNEKNFLLVNPELVKVLKKKLKEVTVKKNFLYHYLYICHVIAYLKTTDKKFREMEYANINYKTAIKVISKYKYKQIITNLLEWGILECDNSVKIGYKSKGYKLKSPYDRNFKRIPVKDKKMNKKLNEFRQSNTLKNQERSLAYQYLEETNKWITIDSKKALKYNKDNYFGESTMSTYDANFYSISNLSDGCHRFTVDSTGNRAHTNLTNLKSDLRQFLTVDGEHLGDIDIPNSQPLFFYLHIKYLVEIPESEKRRYKEIVESGQFYEFFMERLGIPQKERNNVKQKIIAAIFFDKNRNKESRYVKILKKEFPYIADYIYKTKKDDRTKLASLLQKAESKFIIEKAVNEYINRFGENYEFVSTIHDSIVAQESNLENVKNVLEYCFNEEDIYPILSINLFHQPTFPLIRPNLKCKNRHTGLVRKQVQEI